MQHCSETQSLLLHTSGSHAMIWNVEKKKQEKGILPPSVGASHYTSKESFSLSRYPINHRVIFPHQLLVPSTFVFSPLPSKMEWEILEKRRPPGRHASASAASAFLVLLSQFDSRRKMSGNQRSCWPCFYGLEPFSGCRQSPLLGPAGLTSQCTYSSIHRQIYSHETWCQTLYCPAWVSKTVWNVNGRPLALNSDIGLNQ